MPDNTSGAGPTPLAPVLALGPADPDLAHVAAAWPTLPAPIKAAVLALVAAATPGVAQDAAGGLEAARPSPANSEAR